MKIIELRSEISILKKQTNQAMNNLNTTNMSLNPSGSRSTRNKKRTNSKQECQSGK